MEYNSVSSRALIRHENLIVVEQFTKGNIAFLPGGRIKHSEDLRLALSRELKEELPKGVFRIGRYLGRIGHIWSTDRGSESCLNHFFEVFADFPLNLKSGEEGREFRWLDLSSEEIEKLKPPGLAALLVSDHGIDERWDFVDSELIGKN